MNKYSFFLIGVAVLLLAACSDDKDDAPIVARPLCFTVSETPLHNPDASVAERRIAPTTTATLSAFNYRYVTSNTLSGEENASKNQNGQWTGGNWPNVDNNVEVPFYAYANVAQGNYSVFKDNSNIKLSFTADGQKDLLVASASGTYANSNGTIGFTFDHACGALRFSLKKTTGLSAYTVKVKTVKLYNIPSVGDYCFNDGKWTISNDAKDKRDFTIKSYNGDDGMTVTSDKTYLSDDGDYIFLLPQTLTGGVPSNAYVEIECKIFNGEIYKVGGTNSWGNAYLPLGITIHQGKINPINISMGTALLNASGNKIF